MINIKCVNLLLHLYKIDVLVEASAQLFRFEQKLCLRDPVDWCSYRRDEIEAIYERIVQAKDLVHDQVLIHILEYLVKALVHCLDVFFGPEEVFTLRKTNLRAVLDIVGTFLLNFYRLRF